MIFTPDNINTIVSNAIPHIDPNKTHAIVATVDNRGFQVVASLKKGQTENLSWELQAVDEFKWSTKENEFGGRLILEW